MDDWLRLRPTDEQRSAFAEYLCEAHSWYKHAPLMEGLRFVVFIAADAGMGRRVAVLHGAGGQGGSGCSLVKPTEGFEYTDADPRLHYGWKTTQEYRSRFGYLDYSCWPNEDGSFERDAGPAVRLPRELVERCGFLIYPYISHTFAEGVTWSIHEQALAQLRSGAAHPAREQVLELARLAELRERAAQALSEQERQYIDDREGDKPWAAKWSAAMHEFVVLDEQVHAVTESLRAQEIGKIQRALTELEEWIN